MTFYRALRLLREYQSVAHLGHAPGHGWRTRTPEECRKCVEIAEVIEEMEGENG